MAGTNSYVRVVGVQLDNAGVICLGRLRWSDQAANPASTGQPEDQLRGPLETLFAALAAQAGRPSGTVILVDEASLAEYRPRPDYAVTVRDALVGFIEVKAPGKGADPRRFRDDHDKAQWDKLNALPNLLYTDGNRFAIWRDGVLVGNAVRLDGDVETSGRALAAPLTLLPLIEDFLSWQPIAPRTPIDLGRISARLCRFLRDEVVEQMERGNSALENLAEDWRRPRHAALPRLSSPTRSPIRSSRRPAIPDW